MKRTSKKLLSLVLALVMSLSLMTPAFAAETTVAAADNYVSAADLTELLGVATEAEDPAQYTNQEVIRNLLLWTGLKESQLGTYPADYIAMADSMGMIDMDEIDADAPCTTDDLAEMKAVANVMHEALQAETMEPLFMNGMAQPIFPYTTGSVEEGYDNAESDIIRFFVYVETNYDTDADGKLDLVKALVQLPRAAMEGDFKAATIYEARPYITGCTDRGRSLGYDYKTYTEGYDIDAMYSAKPDAREVAGEITTAEHAAVADSSEWYYYNKYEDMMDYEDLEWYDYYLVRGFAVVECGGIGTRGSEGFETCGSTFEIDAFKCVIEWLHGDRVAYTDKESNIEIKADWSNGKVGMTGRSYAGTTQFGLATTGVEGLETIVPVAGISSWYEYTNAQGVSTRTGVNYTETLALYCAGRMLDLEDWNSISDIYGAYLNQQRMDQLETNGDYSLGRQWEDRDYTLDYENINCTALIVHGINDYNVRTKHSHQMYQAFEKAGAEAKVILHQDGHLTPTYPAGNLQFDIGDQTYDEILNQWFSHYLYDLDNGAEDMPKVVAQSAHDNVWNEYSSWDTDYDLVLNAASDAETVTISSDYTLSGASSRNYQQLFGTGSTANNAMYVTEVVEDVVVNGPVAVNFSAATEAVEGADALMVSAMLVDLGTEEFSAYNTSGSYVPKNMLAEGGAWMGGGLRNYDKVELVTSDVTYRVIARGWMDLCNPEAKYESITALNRVDVDANTYYDYTLFMQPTIYEVEAGHNLALVIYAYEPGMARYTNNYAITLNNASVQALIPVEADGAGVMTATYQPIGAVTAADLLKTLGNDADLSIAGEAVAADHVYTNQELVAVLLNWAGMKPEQLGSYPYDYNYMAASMGLTYEAEAMATDETLAEMKEVFDVLYEALHADKLEPLFMNGMAQPIFPYTTGAVEEGYDNANSDIIRFCVYVETNYDTDADGKLDLVKALVQIPRAAMEGDYKAATIYEARPYITGCTSGSTPYVDGGYDIASMYAQPAARVAAGETTTEAHAAVANSADWYYYNPYERAMVYEDLEWYDYYLVRGFAVVECGGLGTKGSEGFETCGSDLEIDAFKCVIEWLHGDRVAYTDAENNIAIEADWSNGKVGMTGRSYAGTTQFGLATTGVEGLETIVPVAGIASWYEYTNSQGISTNRSPAYTEWLAWYCAGRRLDDADWATIADKYGRYLRQMYNDQMAIAGDYSYEHWGIRDYTLNYANIKAPALIVHGLADYNVRTKQSDLMQQAYQKAGVDYKVILHQDGHLTPTYPAGNLQFDIGDQNYDSILNQWFSHYLYDLDNGVAEMPNVIAQDAHENVWHELDSWGTENYMTLNVKDENETVTITSDQASVDVDRSNFEKVFVNSATDANVLYTVEVTEDMMVNGAVAVNFSAATEAVEGSDSLMVSAMLVDISDEAFAVYNKSGSYVPKVMLKKEGAWMGGGLKNYDKVELQIGSATEKVIAYGWMDLCNPNAKYDSETALHTERVDVNGETYYDYTLYLQPTVYSVEAGHKLGLVIYAQDPSKNTPANPYEITLKTDSINAVVPVEDAADAVALDVTDAGEKTVQVSLETAGGMGKIESNVESNDVVLKHSKVTATATAYGGYEFSHWTNNGKRITPERASITVYVGEDTQLVAHFVSKGDSSAKPIDPVEPTIPVDPTPVEPAFTDVAADAWYADAVEYVTDKGLMTGVSESSFAPASNLTRAMIVQILYSMEGKPAASGEGFSDVADNAWYADAVKWAAANGIVAGVGEGKFAPEANVTREQLAAILMSYAKFKKYDVSVGESTNILSYTDAADVSEYAIPAMQWAVGAGIISGKDGNALDPQGFATRAEVAQMMMKFHSANA